MKRVDFTSPGYLFLFLLLVVEHGGEEGTRGRKDGLVGSEFATFQYRNGGRLKAFSTYIPSNNGSCSYQ